MIVEVVFLPAIATDLSSKLCVVIDVLRATSTLLSMFQAGARRVFLAESVPVALSCAAGFPERPVVCGESGGVRPEGFDHGNSPREFPPGALEGKDVVFCTSNGTKAMRRVSEAPVVLTGSLFNSSAVVRAALREASERGLDVALICSGDILGTKFAIDDAFCAGYISTLMEREASAVLSVDDEFRRRRLQDAAANQPQGPVVAFEESAIAAMRLYRSYLLGEGRSAEAPSVPPRDAILAAFWDAHNAHVLREVGLAEDVEHCAQVDITHKVPRLGVEDGRLVLS